MKGFKHRGHAARSASVCAATLAAIALHPAPARAEQWVAFERLAGFAPVEATVSGKPRTYFRLTSKTPLEIPVEGPVRLRFTSRVEIPGGAGPVATYKITAAEGTRTIEELSTETSVGSEVKAQGSSTPLGKSRKMTIDVGTGSHKVTLTLAGANAALVRVQQSGPVTAEAPMVTLTPVSASRSVSVSEGEKIIPYYTALSGQPVKLRVVGPVVLELLTRLDFDDTMRGTATYRLRIVESRHVLREAEFKTSKATTATYTNLPDRVPSKFDRIRLPLSEGLHEIAVQLVQPARGAAEIHARIPQPAVGNEE